MDIIHKDVENLFLENYIHNNFERIYSLDIDQINVDLSKTSETNKNINILNKSFEIKKIIKNLNKKEVKNKSKDDFNYENNSKSKDKKEIKYATNNIKIIKTIFKNKNKLILKDNNDINNNNNKLMLKIDKSFNNNFLSDSIISNLFKKFKNLNFLFKNIYNKNNKTYNKFLDDLKNCTRNINFKIKNNGTNNNIKNNFDLNFIKNFKIEICELKKDKEKIIIHNNNLILMNKKNFLIFKNNYLKFEFAEKNSNDNRNINLNLDKKDYDLKCFKDSINSKYNFHYKDIEKDFNDNLKNLENMNIKKLKILDNLIKEKIKNLVKYYKDKIFNNKNIKLFEDGILVYFKEIIKFDKKFNYKLLDKYFNKIDSKYYFLKLKIYSILKNQKKKNSNDSNLSYKSIELNKNYPIIKNHSPKIKTKLNKSFEIKNIKYFNFSNYKKFKINNRNIKKISVNKNNNMDNNFILNTKESDLNINIIDLIKLENKLDQFFIDIKINGYTNNLNNFELNYYDNNKLKKLNEIKNDLFFNLIKVFGVKKTKRIIDKNISKLSYDYHLFTKKEF